MIGLRTSLCHPSGHRHNVYAMAQYGSMLAVSGKNGMVSLFSTAVNLSEDESENMHQALNSFKVHSRWISDVSCVKWYGMIACILYLLSVVQSVFS